eukprot:gb/GEZN01000064.1/.p1 GENE.gb/GEZN01000064.1/~~gb/GEZN01000064.1/.p1  ORF type:complete len:2685 (-),score=656.30 gb/GEZN01000064.1/:208-8262(-)
MAEDEDKVTPLGGMRGKPSNRTGYRPSRIPGGKARPSLAIGGAKANPSSAYQQATKLDLDTSSRAVGKRQTMMKTDRRKTNKLLQKGMELSEGKGVSAIQAKKEEDKEASRKLAQFAKLTNDKKLAVKVSKSKEGLQTLKASLLSKPRFAKMVEYSLQCITNLAVDDLSTTEIIEEGIVEVMARIAKLNPYNERIQRAINESVQKLAAGSPALAAEVSKHFGTKALIHSMKKHVEAETLRSTCASLVILTKPSPSNETDSAITDFHTAGVLEAAHGILNGKSKTSSGTANPAVQGQAAAILHNLSHKPEYAKAIVESKAMEAVLESCADPKLQTDATLVLSAAGLVANITRADKASTGVLKSVGAVDILVAALEVHPSNKEVLISGAVALAHLTGKEDVLSSMAKPSGDSDAHKQMSKLASLLLVPENVEFMIRNKGVQWLLTEITNCLSVKSDGKETKKQQEESAGTVVNGLRAIARLCTSSETVDALHKGRVMDLLTTVVHKYSENPEVMGAVMETLTQLAWTKTHAEAIARHLLMPKLTEIGQRHIGSEALVKSSVDFYNRVSAFQTTAPSLVKADVIQFLNRALITTEDPYTSHQAIKALSTLVIGEQENMQICARSGGLKSLVSTARKLKKDPDAALTTLRLCNVMANITNLAEEMHGLGITDTIMEILDLYPSNQKIIQVAQSTLKKFSGKEHASAALAQIREVTKTLEGMNAQSTPPPEAEIEKVLDRAKHYVQMISGLCLVDENKVKVESEQGVESLCKLFDSILPVSTDGGLLHLRAECLNETTNILINLSDLKPVPQTLVEAKLSSASLKEAIAASDRGREREERLLEKTQAELEDDQHHRPAAGHARTQSQSRPHNLLSTAYDILSGPSSPALTSLNSTPRASSRVKKDTAKNGEPTASPEGRMFQLKPTPRKQDREVVEENTESLNSITTRFLENSMRLTAKIVGSHLPMKWEKKLVDGGVIQQTITMAQKNALNEVVTSKAARILGDLAEHHLGVMVETGGVDVVVDSLIGGVDDSEASQDNVHGISRMMYAAGAPEKGWAELMQFSDLSLLDNEAVDGKHATLSERSQRGISIGMNSAGDDEEQLAMSVSTRSRKVSGGPAPGQQLEKLTAKLLETDIVPSLVSVLTNHGTNGPTGRVMAREALSTLCCMMRGQPPDLMQSFARTLAQPLKNIMFAYTEDEGLMEEVMVLMNNIYSAQSQNSKIYHPKAKMAELSLIGGVEDIEYLSFTEAETETIKAMANKFKNNARLNDGAFKILQQSHAHLSRESIVPADSIEARLWAELNRKREEEAKIAQKKEEERKQREEEEARRRAEAAKAVEEERARLEAERLRRIQEEEKRRKEEEERRLAEEKRRQEQIREEEERRADEERKRKEEMEVRKKQEEEQRKREEERLREIEEAKRRKEEERLEIERLLREEEEKRAREEELKRKQEEEKRLKEEQERMALLQAEEDKKKELDRLEEERKAREEEERRRKAEEEAKRKAEEEKRRREEEERLRKEEEERLAEIARIEAERKKREEEERLRKEEEERKRKEEEARRAKEEEERQAALEAERKRREEEDAKRKAEEERLFREEEARRIELARELRRQEEAAKKRQAEEQRRLEEEEAHRKAKEAEWLIATHERLKKEAEEAARLLAMEEVVVEEVEEEKEEAEEEITEVSLEEVKGETIVQHERLTNEQSQTMFGRKLVSGDRPLKDDLKSLLERLKNPVLRKKCMDALNVEALSELEGLIGSSGCDEEVMDLLFQVCEQFDGEEVEEGISVKVKVMLKKLLTATQSLMTREKIARLIANMENSEEALMELIEMEDCDDLLESLSYNGGKTSTAKIQKVLAKVLKKSKDNKTRHRVAKTMLLDKEMLEFDALENLMNEGVDEEFLEMLCEPLEDLMDGLEQPSQARVQQVLVKVLAQCKQASTRSKAVAALVSKPLSEEASMEAVGLGLHTDLFEQMVSSNEDVTLQAICLRDMTAQAGLQATLVKAFSTEKSITALMKAIKSHMDQPAFVSAAVAMMHLLNRTDPGPDYKIKQIFGNQGAMEVLLEVLEKYDSYEGEYQEVNLLLSDAHLTLAVCTAGVDDNCHRLLEAGGVGQIVESMALQEDNEDVCGAALSTLLHLTKVGEEAVQELLTSDEGVMRLIGDPIVNHDTRADICLDSMELIQILAKTPDPEGTKITTLLKSGAGSAIVAGLSMHGLGADSSSAILNSGIRSLLLLTSLAKNEKDMLQLCYDGAIQAAQSVSETPSRELQLVALTCLVNISKFRACATLVTASGAEEIVMSNLATINYESEMSSRSVKLFRLLSDGENADKDVLLDMRVQDCISEALRRNLTSSTIQLDGLAAVAKLSHDTESAIALEEAGFLELVCQIYSRHSQVKALAPLAIEALQALARNKHNAAIIAEEAAHIIKAVWKDHPKSGRSVLGGMVLVGVLSAHTDVKAILPELELVEPIIHLCQMYGPKQKKILVSGLTVLYNAALGTEQCRKHLKDHNASSFCEAELKKPENPASVMRLSKAVMDLLNQHMMKTRDVVIKKKQEHRRDSLPRDVRNFLLSGSLVLKHAHTKTSHSRHLYCDADFKFLILKKPHEDVRKRDMIRIVFIRRAEAGRTTKLLQRKKLMKYVAKKELSFSIESRERELSIEAESEEMRDEWVHALNVLVAWQTGQRKMEADFYTR